uniref:Sulfotransferase domain-containing protein n=1 Tax=viral metagenome TaxID=1070528 RepID=A0A6C0I006_9ZZZZ
MVSINHDLKAIFIHLPKNGGSSISNILHNHYGFDGIRAYRTDHCEFNEDKNNIKLENFENIDSTTHKRFVKVHATYNIRRRGIIRYFKQENLGNANATGKKRKKIFYLRKKFSKKDDVPITDEMWNTYFKFVFIRNPYDRAISGWKFSTRGMPVKPKLIDFLRNKNKVTNVAYSHTFITQKAHLIEADDTTIDFDYYGDFNNLNEELIKILLHLGVKTIKHERLIEKDIIMNKGSEEETKTPYYKYYENQEILDRINSHFKEDFEYFGYTIYNNIQDIKDNYDKILSIPMTNKGKLNKILEISAVSAEEDAKEINTKEISAVIAEEDKETKDKEIKETKDKEIKETKDKEIKETKDKEIKIPKKRGRKKKVIIDEEGKVEESKGEESKGEESKVEESKGEESKEESKKEELYRINNIKKLNKTLITELKEKNLLEEKIELNILIDDKNKFIINNVAGRLLKKKCIPSAMHMCNDPNCNLHNANANANANANVNANANANVNKCNDPNCNLHHNNIQPNIDLKKLYAEYKKNKPTPSPMLTAAEGNLKDI